VNSCSCINMEQNPQQELCHCGSVSLYLLRHHKGENPSYGDPQSTQAPLSDVSTRVRNNCMIHQGLNPYMPKRRDQSKVSTA